MSLIDFKVKKKSDAALGTVSAHLRINIKEIRGIAKTHVCSELREKCKGKYNGITKRGSGCQNLLKSRKI